MRIHLIRHPEPAVDRGVCYGQSDVGLTVPAAQAAERLRPLLPERYRLISSPLRRCRELATVLAPDHRCDPRLREIHFGEWEGRRWDDIPRHHLDDWAAAPFDHTPPGGESATAMAERVIAFAAELAGDGTGDLHGDEELVLVAHLGPLRVLMAHWLDLPRDSWLKLHVDFAASSCVECTPHGNHLRWLNR